MKTPKNLVLQLASNLHIKGDEIISYDTVVAKIKEDHISVLGKFSRTTSKHISKAVFALGLPSRDADKKPTIYWTQYYMGCEPTVIRGSISQEVTDVLLKNVYREGLGFEESLLTALVKAKALNKCKRSDVNVAAEHLGEELMDLLDSLVLIEKNKIAI
jgi:hypothetical protein